MPRNISSLHIFEKASQLVNILQLEKPMVPILSVIGNFMNQVHK